MENKKCFGTWGEGIQVLGFRAWTFLREEVYMVPCLLYLQLSVVVVKSGNPGVSFLNFLDFALRPTVPIQVHNETLNPKPESHV